MYIGEELTLFYNPLRPTLLTVKGHEYFGFRMTLFMGIVFFLVGISYPFYQLIANLRKKHIVKSGCVLHATIEDIVLNTSVRVNGQSPYVIYCTYYYYTWGEWVIFYFFVKRQIASTCFVNGNMSQGWHSTA